MGFVGERGPGRKTISTATNCLLIFPALNLANLFECTLECPDARFYGANAIAHSQVFGAVIFALVALFRGASELVEPLQRTRRQRLNIALALLAEVQNDAQPIGRASPEY